MRTWYSIYQFTHCLTLQTSDYDVIFVCMLIQRHKRLIQKVQHHRDLIKATCREIDNVYQAMRNNAVDMRGN